MVGHTGICGSTVWHGVRHSDLGRLEPMHDPANICHFVAYSDESLNMTVSVPFGCNIIFIYMKRLFTF